MNPQAKSEETYGPWNPGLESQIPRRYLALSTMFREDNVSTSMDEALELSDFCGLKPHEIVAFHAERLIAHELLIRVSADLSVPDGPNYEDLGINLRTIAANILEDHIIPEIETLKESHTQLQRASAGLIEQELSEHFFARTRPATMKANRSLLGRIFGRPAVNPKPSTGEGQARRQSEAIADWQARGASVADPFEAACISALVKVVNAIIAHRGTFMGDRSTIVGLAVNLVSNGYGSEQLGRAIEPLIRRAAETENYRFLPAQEKPVVMNVKGASAAGKSTIRPQQRELAGKLGIPWEEFALISPDYWRKFLLDYDALGEAYKYAAMLTGHELEIIDKKLDRYMAEKANRGAMSHLLIDRFRFDSFTIGADGDVDSTLLTRFGDLIFMFFMITPPDATVERAWERGLKTGRYKAVDDLLYHNIEAYTGIPQLFFSWASASKKRVHYEFLDNSVPEGRRPRTVAFGWNETMTILDIGHLLDIERFKKINIEARQPDEVYRQEDMPAERNVAFLKQCADVIPVINFADFNSGRVYGRLENGKWTWRNEEAAAQVLEMPDSMAGLRAIGWGEPIETTPDADEIINLQDEKAYLLGEWQ